MFNFNILEQKARSLREQGRFSDALNIYLYMSDGDPSLDAGYLGERIGECYEALGDPHSAKYWYGRAVEENPTVRLAATEARKRLSGIGIDYLFESERFGR
jgi:tetratricopeptide (TPR) repeat protein